MGAPAMPGWLPSRKGAAGKVEVLSTESIPGASSPTRDRAERCASCGSPLAPDQRYCLECGERRAAVSDFLRDGPPTQASPPAAPPGSRPPGAPAAAPAPRGGAVPLLAGIGVLLLAMGVGVLIGRSSSSSGPAPAPQVVQIGGTGGAGTGTGTVEETFTGSWPATKKGWTVELQTLPEGSKPSTVEAAKTAAGAKGASAAGALKAEEFPSVGGEGFVIYSGEYVKKAEARRALGPLKKSFPAAKVIEVSGGGSAASGSGSSAAKPGTSSKGGGGSLKKPAPSSTLSGHERASGKKYVEESAKLPDVVSTG